MLFSDDLAGDDLRPPKIEGVLRRLREEQLLREQLVDPRRSTTETDIVGTGDESADPGTR